MELFFLGMLTGWFAYWLICRAFPMPKASTPLSKRRRRDSADWWKRGDECPY